MDSPMAKSKRVLDIGETKFELAVTIRDEPLMNHTVRIADAHGNSVDVPAKDLFNFTAQAFVLPHRKSAMDLASEDGDFYSILLNKI